MTLFCTGKSWYKQSYDIFFPSSHQGDWAGQAGGRGGGGGGGWGHGGGGGWSEGGVGDGVQQKYYYAPMSQGIKNKP